MYAIESKVKVLCPPLKEKKFNSKNKKQKQLQFFHKQSSTFNKII